MWSGLLFAGPKDADHRRDHHSHGRLPPTRPIGLMLSATLLAVLICLREQNGHGLHAGSRVQDRQAIRRSVQDRLMHMCGARSVVVCSACESRMDTNQPDSTARLLPADRCLVMLLEHGGVERCLVKGWRGVV